MDITDGCVEIAKLRNDGAAEFNWPAIEITAAKWSAGSRDTLVSMARLLLMANNSAATEHDAVAAERERSAMKLQVTRSDVQLAAGELSAEEWRMCAAVLRWMQGRIRGA